MICRQFVPVLPRFEIVRLVVEAKVEIDSTVDVAFVVEALIMVRFVIVEVAWLMRMVPKPEAKEPEERAPVEVREEPVTPEPKVVPERTEASLILKTLPEERFKVPPTERAPVNCPAPAI